MWNNVRVLQSQWYVIKIEFEKFINEINSTEAKVLIPAFSLQRTQEITYELKKNEEKLFIFKNLSG